MADVRGAGSLIRDVRPSAMRAQDIEFQLPWVGVTVEEKARFEAELIAEKCLLHNLGSQRRGAVLVPLRGTPLLTRRG
jgi:hypothetical protein